MSQELEEKVAARLWRAESEDAGAPASIPAGRTLDAFREQREDTKARWHKFARAALAVVREEMREAELLGLGRWRLGTRVTKIKGSSWTGHVVGYYRTKLTPVGYCVESETETGSVQLYPAAALRASPLGEQ